MSKNHPRAILCGILFLLSAGVGRAQDSAVKDTGHVDANSLRQELVAEVKKAMSLLFPRFERDVVETDGACLFGGRHETP